MKMITYEKTMTEQEQKLLEKKYNKAFKKWLEHSYKVALYPRNKKYRDVENKTREVKNKLYEELYGLK